jgi:hypothetical protein
MEPTAATPSVVCSLFGQGISVRQPAAVVVCIIASDRAPWPLPAAPAGPTPGRRPVTPTKALTCAHCGDVIGVYEPLILAGDGEVRETSLAADRDVASSRTTYYHRACYLARSAEASAGQ